MNARTTTLSVHMSTRWLVRYIAAILVMLPMAASADPAAPAKPQTIEELKAAGWKMPPCPYPYASVVHKETGSGLIELTTGADGKVAEAEMIQKIGHPSLDTEAVTYAKAQWTGPPNSKAITKITFTLN